MSNDEREYSDEEFAIILRKAADLASTAESREEAQGLTLKEMKAAAAQAGFDPVHIERAARLLAAGADTSPLERVVGGPIRHSETLHLPVRLDTETAARLLSAVRVRAGLAGSHDTGHSGPMGMAWHDGGDIESLSVTARPEEDGTTVSVTLDRRATLGLVSLASGTALFLATLFSAAALYPEAAVLGYAGGIAGVGGILAGARAYWAASTRKARERIRVAVEAVSQTLTRPEDAEAPPLAESGGPQSIRPPSGEEAPPHTR